MKPCLRYLLLALAACLAVNGCGSKTHYKYRIAVILDCNLDKQELRKKPDLIDKYVATDNYNGGRLAGEHLLKVLEKEGEKTPNVVLFRYAVGSESTEQREKGFLAYLDEQRKKG